MRCIRRGIALLVFALSVCGLLATTAGAQATDEQTPPQVLELELDGVVDPFVADYIRGGIGSAQDRGSDAVLITVDTPGGLDSAMREIVQSILTSRTPVLCYVSPQGARAASAGMYILLSCPIAAMAPGTNVGAATPVGLSGAVASDKAVEDSVAYARSLAQRHDRNADWAERAVRDAASLPAEEALSANVIDVVAPSTPALLNAVDGDQVEVAGAPPVTLRTAGAEVTQEELGWGVGFVHALLDPNLAFLFFWLGLGLMILEFFLPHFGVAGVIGFVLFLLSIAAFGMLPVQLVGIVLLVVAAILLILEIHTPGFGVLGTGGIIALVAGGLLLFDGSDVRVSPLLIAAVAAVMIGFFGFVLTAAMKLRHHPPIGTHADIVGLLGRALTDLAPDGVVHVAGEEWSATSIAGPMPKDAQIRVVAKNGLRLDVEPDHAVTDGETQEASAEKEGSAS
ncbi:MAG: nodulation protein NfeD [Actinomycetota bacterium]